MPLKVTESWSFGGVDSRSNPANFPAKRAIRCLNWEPQQNGKLQLRRGFSTPTMGTGSTATGTIHSAIYYEQVVGTPQYILYGQGTSISRLRLSDGQTLALTSVVGGNAMGSTNPWGFYRANGKIFLSDGNVNFRGYSYDGTTLRSIGIGLADPSSVIVNATTGGGGGSFNTTVLSGYLFYLAYFNPLTGHVGNRSLIPGAPITIPGAGYAIVFTGLPTGGPEGPEVVKIIGRTPDGGQVPYWMTDANQNNITIANAASTATFTSANVNFNEELPTRNGVMPSTGLSMFCKVLGRIFGATGKDIFIYYSEAEEDVVSGIFVGRPEESWPGDNAEAYPTGGVPTCLASYNNLGWFFSRYHLAQWSESLRQSVSDPWIGPWPTGCASKRAFIETNYGPFWVSGTKRLMTFGPFGPVQVSGEYERALLAKISDANLALTELAYYEDPINEIDRIEIYGQDANNNPVIVIHDFKLNEEPNFYVNPGGGQGYSRSYPTMTMRTFVRQTEAITFMRNANNKLSIWAGDTSGAFRQLEDGNSDSGAMYTADYIGLMNMGLHDARVPGVSWFGDGNVNFSWYMGADMDTALSKFNSVATEILDASRNLYEGAVGSQGSFLYYRFQLTAHPADGNFDLTDPPFCPQSAYGVIYGARLKEGAIRSEGRK